MTTVNLNLDELVVEINQLEQIASTMLEFDADVQTFKLRSTNVSAVALEIKDLLGRSEYNTIQIHEATVTPDRQASPGETWIDVTGAIRTYESESTVKGFTIIKCLLSSAP